MKRRKRIRFTVSAAILALLFLLTGCTLGSNVESLFALPQLPEDYLELSETLKALLDEGYTYLMPSEGPNYEAVQMVDLNGDGKKEAVVLLQRTTEKKPLKVMLFRQEADRFEQICLLENAAAGIDSVDYCDLTGDGAAELLIGWRGEDEKRILSVYYLGYESVTLLDREYASYLLCDLTEDGVPELLLLREDTSEQTNKGTAELYLWKTDMLGLSQTCRLSSTMDEIRHGSILGGYLTQGVPAVFISGIRGKDTAATDILTYTKGEIGNVTEGHAVYRCCQLTPQDIDGDGVTELPHCASATDETDFALSKDSLVNWLRCDEHGKTEKAAETYHCQSCGWYMTWRESLWGRITVKNIETVSGENCTEFFLDGEPMAELYSITCENRESRAQMDDRFLVTRLPGIIYAGKVYVPSEKYGEAVTELRDSFSLIVNTWNAEDKEAGR